MLWILTPFAMAQEPAASGEVVVRTSAKDATVFLDGQDTGELAPVILEGLSPGEHEIQVRTTDCLVGTVQVQVRAGAIEQVEVDPQTPGASLSVSSSPEGAQVLLDGEVLGQTPLESTPVACGQHQVELQLEGHADASEEIDLAFGDSAALELSLETRQEGSLVVKVSPLEAEVLVDGEPVGVGPLTVDGLAAGAHQVEARASGFETASQPVQVAVGEMSRVELSLVERPGFYQRSGLSRVRWGTVGLSSGLAAGAVVTGVVSLQRYQLAKQNYGVYSELTYLDDPEGVYSEQVAAPRRSAQILALTSGALFAGAVGSAVFMPILDPKQPAVAVVVHF